MRRPRLRAPRGKVVPFLRQLLAEGEAIAERPITSMDDFCAGHVDGERWLSTAGEAFRRAFDESYYWLDMHQTPKDMPAGPSSGEDVQFYAAYWAISWRHKLAIMRQAIQAAEERP